MKLKIAIVSFIIELLVTVSIVLVNDSQLMIKVQLPLIMLFGYFSATFFASYLLERMIKKANENNLQDQPPYSLLIKFNPIINLLIFGFFGLLTLVSSISIIMFM